MLSRRDISNPNEYFIKVLPCPHRGTAIGIDRKGNFWHNSFMPPASTRYWHKVRKPHLTHKRIKLYHELIIAYEEYT